MSEIGEHQRSPKGLEKGDFSDIGSEDGKYGGGTLLSFNLKWRTRN